MHVDRVGTPRDAVIAAAVLVLADQFLLLGVNRNDRLASRLKRCDLAVDVLELPVAVGVAAALFGLAIDLARIPEGPQHLAHRVGTDGMVQSAQGRSQLLQTFRYPQEGSHRIPHGRRFHQPAQVFQHGWVGLAQRRSAGTLAPHSLQRRWHRQ